MKNVGGEMLLNASVDAKSAKKEYQGRKERKGKRISFGFPLRPWLFSWATFASTLAFNTLSPVHDHSQASLS